MDRVLALLKEAGFKEFFIKQTIFHKLESITKIEPIKDGYGEGIFVAIEAVK